MTVQASLKQDVRPTLIGYLPPLEGIRKTGGNYGYHSTLINSGDLVYAYASTMLTSGKNYVAWDFRASPEEINEKFSKVVFFIPCRIAPPPYDGDGYPYEFITQFIEKLRIPFFSLAESIQSRSYDYEVDFHKTLSSRVVRYLNVVADRSPIVGVRGHYSADVLNKLGIKNVMPLGCSSLYLNGPQLKDSLLSPPSSPRQGKVAMCYSNYQGNPGSRMGDFLRFADKGGFHYVEQTFGFVPQALYYPGKISASSIHAAKRIYQALPSLLSLLEKGLVHYFSNYKLWKDFLASMDFVFGARMHGLTPAIHAGVPAMFIAHDARVREMCEFLSLPFVGEHELPSELDLQFFLRRCDYTDAFKSYPGVYRQFVDVLHRNGLGENIARDGEIIDPWMPLPDGQVAKEETLPILGREEFLSLAQLVGIGEQVPDDVMDKLAQIQTIAQSLYLLRQKNN